MQTDLAARTYKNAGNESVVALVDPSSTEVLDLGCGAGDNAALLVARDPHKRVFGITASPDEAKLASRYMEQCWVADLEAELPPEAQSRRYDVLLLSHVLEHLRDPARLVERASALLKPGGTCIIAVPNVMCWRERLAFLRGRFEYESTGTMDETHLRFFSSFETADRYLLARSPALAVVRKGVTGSVPLWILRRHVLSERAAAAIDDLGCRLRPNLFGGQVLIKAVKR